jgi:hypothetical protein
LFFAQPQPSLRSDLSAVNLRYTSTANFDCHVDLPALLTCSRWPKHTTKMFRNGKETKKIWFRLGDKNAQGAT